MSSSRSSGKAIDRLGLSYREVIAAIAAKHEEAPSTARFGIGVDASISPNSCYLRPDQDDEALCDPSALALISPS